MCVISVIIPVFNVEDYLSDCINSIINQSFKNIEIICVDDGSSDRSLEILQKFEKIDSRVKVITQKNQGLGATRNNALKKANGDYIYFIDSDDFIDITTLEKLFKNAVSNDSDIVLFKYQVYDANRNFNKNGVEFRIDKIFKNIDYSKFTFKAFDVKKHVLNSAFSACLKLYKKDFLDKFDDMFFTENIYFEDVLFHTKVMLRASKISFVNESLYFYRFNDNSIINSTAFESDIFKVIDMVEDFLINEGYFNDFEYEFLNFKISQILLYIIQSKSENYFKKAKYEFDNLKIPDEYKIKDKYLKGYNLVLKSDKYIDYVLSFYDNEVKRLTNENNKLKKLNNDIKTSKITKLLNKVRGR